jgi:hypothetical protein
LKLYTSLEIMFACGNQIQEGCIKGRMDMSKTVPSDVVIYKHDTNLMM